MDEWITVKEAARVRNCTERNIIKLIDKGELKAKKNGHRWLVLIDTSEPSTEKDPNSTELISLLQAQIEEKDKQIERLQKQIEDKDRFLDDASQRHDTIISRYPKVFSIFFWRSIISILWNSLLCHSPKYNK
ncbi:helix-turn-helix domain-containing protein, partial [Candidatus Poribacteria bacterium]|nr:helix-turn-helix domain-containing protein [Candidatus Poribacteria bacterium]